MPRLLALILAISDEAAEQIASAGIAEPRFSIGDHDTTLVDVGIMENAMSDEEVQRRHDALERRTGAFSLITPEPPGRPDDDDPQEEPPC